MTNQNFRTTHRKVTELSEAQSKILDSLRFQDQNQAAKGGALLTFSALMIATALVQFAADEASFAHIAERGWVFLITYCGLALEFIVSFACIYLFTMTGKFSDVGESALAEYDAYVATRKHGLNFLRWLSVAGAFLIFLSLSISLWGMGFLH